MDSDLLVIGFGNTLRRDDGVGPRAAAELEDLNLAGVRTIACPLLTPELADPLSRASTVVFIDAAVDHPEPVRMRPLAASDSSQVLAHSVDPRSLLALARDAFGHEPEAWLLTVPAKELGFGEQLSPTAERGLRMAVGVVQALHDCRRAPQPEGEGTSASSVRPQVQVRA